MLLLRLLCLIPMISANNMSILQTRETDDHAIRERARMKKMTQQQPRPLIQSAARPDEHTASSVIGYSVSCIVYGFLSHVL